MRLRWLFIGYAVILLFAAAPIISVFVAAAIADWQGCELDEGNVSPCIVAGRDVGEHLNSMFVMGWHMLATIPIGALVFAGWTAVWVVVAQIKGRQARSTRAELA